MESTNTFSIEVMDYELLLALTDSSNLERFETGHDIIEVDNKYFVLQVWVNKMYGSAEIECNFGKKIVLDNQSDQYEFDYLDSIDFIKACKEKSPIEVASTLFLDYLTQYKGA